MRVLLMICMSVGILLVEGWPARSNDVPTLNVTPLCRGIISQSDALLQAGDPSVSMDECLKAEEIDRQTIQKEWSTFSASDRTHCTAEATMGGESSYTDFLTCLEMARDVRRLRMPTSPDTDVKRKRTN
jgi:hypothetical protein